MTWLFTIHRRLCANELKAWVSFSCPSNVLHRHESNSEYITLDTGKHWLWQSSDRRWSDFVWWWQLAAFPWTSSSVPVMQMLPSSKSNAIHDIYCWAHLLFLLEANALNVQTNNLNGTTWVNLKQLSCICICTSLSMRSFFPSNSRTSWPNVFRFVAMAWMYAKSCLMLVLCMVGIENHTSAAIHRHMGRKHCYCDHLYDTMIMIKLTNHF